MKWLSWFRKPDLFGADRSPQWRGVRSAHISKNPYCFSCSDVEDLEVHHIVPFHVEPGLELEPKNLVTLCRQCHFRIGHHGNWRKVNKQVIYDCLIERYGRLS